MDPVEEKFLAYIASLKSTTEAAADLMKTVVDDDALTKAMNNTMSGLQPVYQEVKKSLKTNLEQQQEYLESLTPHEYQDAAKKGFEVFETAYEKSNEVMEKLIKKEEEYIGSDKFLRDSKRNLKRATFFNKMMLNNMDNMLSAYEKAFKMNENAKQE